MIKDQQMQKQPALLLSQQQQLLVFSSIGRLSLSICILDK